MRLKITRSANRSNDATSRYCITPPSRPLAILNIFGASNATFPESTAPCTSCTSLIKFCNHPWDNGRPARCGRNWLLATLALATFPHWQHSPTSPHALLTVRQMACLRTTAGSTPFRSFTLARLHIFRGGNVPPTSLPAIRHFTRSPTIASNEKYSSNFIFQSSNW